MRPSAQSVRSDQNCRASLLERASRRDSMWAMVGAHSGLPHPAMGCSYLRSRHGAAARHLSAAGRRHASRDPATKLWT